MSILQLENLDISIAGKQICSSLNLEFQTGDSWCVLGMNGCGKTTLLHTLAGLLEPDTGNILLNEQPIKSLQRKTIAQQLGILMQHQEDHFPGNVMETVLIGRHPHLANWQWETDTDRQLVLDALSTVGLEGFESRAILSLSGGERQRVALATLLVQQTSLRLLDEPVNHLDIHHQQQMMKVITDKNADNTNIIVLHDINLASQYCDHALLIFKEGNTLAGPCSKVLNENNLSELYQCEIKIIDHDGQPYFIAS